MPILQSFRERTGRSHANLRMDDDAPCLIKLSQNGVFVKKSRLGLFGATIYHEPNGSAAAMTAKALACLYPRQHVPDDMRDPVLRGFVNAAMHCSTLADVSLLAVKIVFRSKLVGDLIDGFDAYHAAVVDNTDYAPTH